MAHTMRGVMVVRLAGIVGLMDARAGQTRRTRIELAVNSSSMEVVAVNSGFNGGKGSKQALALAFYSISHLAWCTPPVQLFSSTRFFRITALCNTPSCTRDLSPSCDTLHSPFAPNNLKHPLSTSISPHSPQHPPSASIPVTLHLNAPSNMPRERGKSRRSAHYYSILSRANRLTPSQSALIAHFSSPQHPSQRTQETLQSAPQLHSVSSVKVEASSSRAHLPLSIPPPLPSLNLVKEEMPPSGMRLPLATNLLAPPIVKPGDPYYGDKSCKVEEEIPPSWQLEDNAVVAGQEAEEIITEVAGQEAEEEQPQHFANRLVEEHLLLLFKIRQGQDDQMHSQSILGQRMDILFDALTDAPARARCPTCGQQFTPAYTIHGQPSSAKD